MVRVDWDGCDSRGADESLAGELLRPHCLARGQAMASGQYRNQRFPNLEFEGEARGLRLASKQSHIQLALHQCIRKFG